MHCDAEFDAPIEESAYAGGGTRPAEESEEWGAGDDPDAATDWGDSDAEVTEHPSGWDDTGDGSAPDGHTQGWREGEGAADTSAATDRTESTVDDTATPDSVADYGATGDDAAGGASDVADSGIVQMGSRILAVALVVVVGLIGTLVFSIASLSAPLPLWIPMLFVGFFGIVGGGVVIARRDSGIDALADALYVAAASLLGLPFVFALFAPSSDPIGERLVVGAMLAFMAAFVAVPLFIVGYWLQPDDEEIPFT
jgi:hypothetical protein